MNLHIKAAIKTFVLFMGAILFIFVFAFYPYATMIFVVTSFLGGMILLVYQSFLENERYRLALKKYEKAKTNFKNWENAKND